MNIFVNPDKEVLDKVLRRPTLKFKEIKKIVKPIIKKVKTRGDKALIKFAHEYDHVELENLVTSPDELRNAEKEVSPKT